MSEPDVTPDLGGAQLGDTAQLVDAAKLDDGAQNGDPAFASQEAVRLEDVHKSFGDLEVVRGIDLSVAPHQVICLIGASGSGKSTLLRCVNLLESVNRGRILLWGQDRSEEHTSELQSPCNLVCR